MTFQTFYFFIKEAWIGIWRSQMMAAISVMTASISLLLMGVFLIFQININNLSEQFSQRLTVRVFLLDKTDAALFEKSLRQFMWVESLEFVDKQSAWAEFKVQFSHLQLDQYYDNPLPSSFRIKRRSEFPVKEVVKDLQNLDGVEHINYGGDLAERLEQFAWFAKIGGVFLLGVLSLATMFIIINTIRLTVIAREEEISIMRLVGAQKTLIQGPFLVEGCMIGIFGAALADLSLMGFLVLVRDGAFKFIPFVPLILDGFLIHVVYWALLVVGIIIGTGGAYISIARTLK